MELWSSVLVALLLLVAAAWLMGWHVRSWLAVKRRKRQLEPEELDYRRRQFRRRMQTSAMLGLVGMGMLVGWVLLVRRAPLWLVVIFWGGVLVLVVWLGLLAVADILSTRYYFGRLKQDYLIQKARLQAELRRLQRIRGNGQVTKDKRQKQHGMGAQGPEAKDNGLHQGQ